MPSSNDKMLILRFLDTAKFLFRIFSSHFVFIISSVAYRFTYLSGLASQSWLEEGEVINHGALFEHTQIFINLYQRWCRFGIFTHRPQGFTYSPNILNLVFLRHHLINCESSRYLMKKMLPKTKRTAEQNYHRLLLQEIQEIHEVRANKAAASKNSAQNPQIPAATQPQSRLFLRKTSVKSNRSSRKIRSSSLHPPVSIVHWAWAVIALCSGNLNCILTISISTSCRAVRCFVIASDEYSIFQS